MVTTAPVHAAPVWAYIRVSGDEQADRGLPVAGQRRAVEEYATNNGLLLDQVFVDEARSGGTDQREQFQLMMRLAHQNPPPCSAILLWSWSRFARDQDDAHFWKASLRRHGVQILDVSGEAPRVDGFEYVLEALIHWKDAQKLIEVSTSARRGQQTLAAMGYIPSGCQPPRGYRVEFEDALIEGRKRRLRRWVPDPETWPLVRRAWEMRLQGRSYRDIIIGTGLYKSAGCFSTFFTNTAYKGFVDFGGTNVDVEPMVTEEQWAKVNSKRATRRSGAYSRRKGSRFVLSGLVKCGRCGSSVNGSVIPRRLASDGYRRQEWRYYQCLGAKQRRCDLPRLKADDLEKGIVERLMSEVLTEDNLADQLTTIAAERDSNRSALDARLANLRHQLDDVMGSIERLLDAIESSPGSESLIARLRQREGERDRLQSEIAKARAHLESSLSDVGDLTGIREALSVGIAAGPPEAARNLLRAIIAEIRVDRDTALIRYRYPLLISDQSMFSAPKGSRIPVAALKGLCPRPLDDGGVTGGIVPRGRQRVK